MKKTIKLELATKIKESLDNRNGTLSVDKDNLLIQLYNSIPIGEERDVDIAEIEAKKEVKLDLIMILYEAIIEANLRKLKKAKHTNSFYIKKLNQLKNEKFHLSEVTKADTRKKEGQNGTVAKLLSFIKPKD